MTEALTRKERRHQLRFGPFADYVRDKGCLVCRQRGPSHPHHVKSVGSGGLAPENLVPLCLVHHNQIHYIGIDTFSAQHNIDLPVEATRLWLRFRTTLPDQASVYDDVA